jgi:hypothetical protein
MRFKGTVALFIVLIVVGAYVYFTEFHGKEERQKQEESKNNAIQIDAKDITEISLIYPDRTITGNKKAEKQWEITSPATLEADSAEWEQLASGIGRLQRGETVAQDVQDLSPYGLQQPPVKLVAKLKDGKSVGFLIGGDNPKKIGKYAKLVDGNEVFLIAPPSERAFTKTLIDMRNKNLLAQADWQKVDKIEIRRGPENFVLLKTGSDWKRGDGKKLQSDKVSRTLNTLEGEKASDIIDNPKTLSDYGLDKPKLEFILGAGSKEVGRIAFGAVSTTPEGIYVKSSAGAPVMIVSKGAFASLNVNPDDLVDNGEGTTASPAPPGSPPTITPPPVVMQKKGS